MNMREVRKNNKGFSLVELIIVMAIMAILIGAIAPQVFAYVEESRESKDRQILATVFTAVQTSIAAESGSRGDIKGSLNEIAAAIPKVKDLLQDEYETVANIRTNAKSKVFKDADHSVYVTYTASNEHLEVFLGVNTGVAANNVGPIVEDFKVTN